MSDHLERLLRTTVADLAAESQPRDLMPQVRARARRIRLVHRTGYLAAALTVVLLLVVPYLAVSRNHGLTPPITNFPTPSLRPSPTATPSVPVAPAPTSLNAPVALLPGWVVTAATPGRSAADPASPPRSWVLDRRTRGYVPVPYPTAVLAPSGFLVAVTGPDGSGLGVLDLRTRKVSWPLDKTVGNPQWSPDGSRLLVTLDDKATGAHGFAVVDPVSGAVDPHMVDRDKYRCNDNCEFS